MAIYSRITVMGRGGTFFLIPCFLLKQIHKHLTYLTRAVIVAVPFIVGIFCIGHVMSSSKYTHMTLKIYQVYPYDTENKPSIPI